jgi:hypothetical protein
MTPEAAVRACLVANAEVAALVASRIYALKLPQPPTLPAVTYQRISAQRDHTLSGPSGLVRSRVQIDAWGRTYSEAKSVADAVRRALAHFEDATVQAALITSDRDLFEDEVNTYRISSDWIIWFVEEPGG